MPYLGPKPVNVRSASSLIVDGSLTAGQVNSDGAVIATGAGTFGDDVNINGNITTTGITDNATSTALTIDSSGNVFVGATSLSLATESIALRERGEVYMTSDGRAPLVVNRLSNDGDIVSLRKDGTQLGSIGVSNDKLQITSEDELQLGVYGTPRVRIFSSLMRPEADNQYDLGISSNRFKDLYLSGGVYLGGTGAANQLDDYETGLWSPSIYDDTGLRSTHTDQGIYVKIGDMIWVSARMFGGSSFTSTGTPYIILPFAAGGGLNMSVSSSVYSVGAGGATGIYLIDGASTLKFTNNTDDAFGNELGNGTTMTGSSKRFYFGPIVYSIN